MSLHRVLHLASVGIDRSSGGISSYFVFEPLLLELIFCSSDGLWFSSEEYRRLLHLIYSAAHSACLSPPHLSCRNKPIDREWYPADWMGDCLGQSGANLQIVQISGSPDNRYDLQDK
jgi:hypothetical protein